LLISGGIILVLLIATGAFMIGRKSVPTSPNQPNNPSPSPIPPRPNPPNPPEIPDNSEAEKLANLIKADLQDALTNDSRWKRT
jgi:hypothetical protein